MEGMVGDVFLSGVALQHLIQHLGQAISFLFPTHSLLLETCGCFKDAIVNDEQNVWPQPSVRLEMHSSLWEACKVTASPSAANSRAKHTSDCLGSDLLTPLFQMSGRGKRRGWGHMGSLDEKREGLAQGLNQFLRIIKANVIQINTDFPVWGSG